MEPFAMPIMLRIVLIMVHAARQIIEVPQMTSPQKRQLREQKQEVKAEHETWFAEGEEHLHFNGDVY